MEMKKRNLLSLNTLLALLLLGTGCAVKPEIDPNDRKTGQERTLASTIQDLSGDDPIEPFNRCMFFLQDGLMYYIIRPVSWVYGSILPREVIKRIDYASDNLAFPGRMVSCFLQCKWKGGCTEFGRFLVNSTVGIGGLFDPAEYYLNWNRRPENMGHAFAHWGIGPGGVFYLPLSTSFNPRDVIGDLFDSCLDGKFILPYAQSACALNRAVNSFDQYNFLMESSFDRYELFKDAMLALRYTEVNDLRYHLKLTPPKLAPELKLGPIAANLVSIRGAFQPQDPWTDTLRCGYFTARRDHSRWWIRNSLWNRDFPGLGSTRTIYENEKKEGTRRYTFWHEKDNPLDRNELVLILPGVGTSRTGAMALALAELLSDGGYAVVLTDNVMHWEFASTKDSARPGFVPADAERVRKHLQSILADLKSRDPSFQPSKILLAGYSMGGLHALHIAAKEAQQNTLGISRYLAVNPPVDMLYAVKQFDTCSAVSKQWTKKRFYEEMGDALVKYLPSARKSMPFQPEEIQRDLAVEKTPGVFRFVKENKHDPRIYLSTDQSRVLWGFSLRLTLRELLGAGARQGLLPGKNLSWGSRTEFYRNTADVGAEEYMKNFVFPQYPGKTIGDLQNACSLRSMEDFLRSSPQIRILHTLDDPLLSAGDITFLDRTLGKRLTWFDAGGHLGHLYMPVVQDVLLNQLEK